MIVVQTPTPFVLEGGTRPIAIGYSVSGRPIEVYTFGNGEKQRMIVAGIHGGYEWNTIALADELMKYINENPDVIPSDVTLYILRNLNPDGDARDHGIDGRVNDHGVDLNRNFPTNWAPIGIAMDAGITAQQQAALALARSQRHRPLMGFLTNA